MFIEAFFMHWALFLMLYEAGHLKHDHSVRQYRALVTNTGFGVKVLG